MTGNVVVGLACGERKKMFAWFFQMLSRCEETCKTQGEEHKEEEEEKQQEEKEEDEAFFSQFMKEKMKKCLLIFTNK